MLCISLSLQGIEANETIQVGNFVKYDVTITPTLEDEITPTWIRFEFVHLEGENATISATMHLSDGTDWEYVTYINMVSGSGTGLLIPPDVLIGDYFHLEGYGDVSIVGEQMVCYTGVNRTAVFARYSNATDSISLYWDKRTGIMLEQNSAKYESTLRWNLVDTNLWQTQGTDNSLHRNTYYIGVILVATLLLIVCVRFRTKKPKRRRRQRRTSRSSSLLLKRTSPIFTS